MGMTFHNTDKPAAKAAARITSSGLSRLRKKLLAPNTTYTGPKGFISSLR